MRGKYSLIFAVLAVFLAGLLAACGENANLVGGGPVPPNTVIPIKTANTAAPIKATSTPAPSVTADTPPQVTSVPPNFPIPTTTPYPTRQPVAGIPAFGTTIYYTGKITNIEAQENSLAAYKQGQPGQWEAVLYGFEGGVSSLLFIYKGYGQQVTLLADATHVTMARPEDMVVKEYTCKSIGKTSNYVEMNGCSDGKETNHFQLPMT